MREGQRRTSETTAGSQTVLNSPHLVLAVVLPVLRVPYSDDDVSGAEVEIWVICNVVHADIFLQTDDLDLKRQAYQAKS